MWTHAHWEIGNARWREGMCDVMGKGGWVLRFELHTLLERREGAGHGGGEISMYVGTLSSRVPTYLLFWRG